MAILGRILQFVGWLWIGASFFGNFIDLPNFGFFPGLILVFLSRLIRTQAKRQERAKEADEPIGATPESSLPRPLYTERSKQTPEAAKPEPVTRTAPKASPVRQQVVWPKEESGAEPERDSLSEEILVAGSELADDKAAEGPVLEPSYEGKPLTSAEMIARARQRWDRKP